MKPSDECPPVTICNPEARACAQEHGPDCRYLVPAPSWWCANDERAEATGSTFPGDVNCQFYEPLTRWDEPVSTALMALWCFGGSVLMVAILIVRAIGEAREWWQ